MYAFACITVACTLIIIWFMPKHLSRKEFYITWITMAAVTIYTDLTFGLVFDMYDFVSPDTPLLDLFVQATLPPSFGIIFLNFMPKSLLHFIPYLLFVVLISLLYESLSVAFAFLIYKGWKLWYSAPFYFFGMIYLRWHLHYIRSR